MMKSTLYSISVLVFAIVTSIGVIADAPDTSKLKQTEYQQELLDEKKALLEKLAEIEKKINRSNTDEQSILEEFEDVFDSLAKVDKELREKSKTDTFKLKVRADNDPNSIGASNPASVAFTVNTDGDDSYRIQLGVEAEARVSDAFGGIFLGPTVSYQRNTETRNLQNQFSVGLRSYFLKSLYQEEDGYKFFSVRPILDFTYNRRVFFPDLESAVCVNDPNLPQCDEQVLETFRPALSFSFLSDKFEGFLGKACEDSGGLKCTRFYAFSPSFTIFHDEAINTPVNTQTGLQVNGGVSGIRVEGSFVVAPSILKRKWQFGLNGQLIQTFNRDTPRISTFDETTGLFTASLDYAIAGDSFGNREDESLLTTIRLSYTVGEDPLNGRTNQSVVGLSLGVRY